MNRYFYCYSRPLMDFFVSKGLQYILYARHPATLKRYWVFERNEQLEECLFLWKDRKNKQVI